MKLALIGITLMLYALISTITHAAERPILGKYNYPGFVFEEDYREESCEVFEGGHILKTISNAREILSVEQFDLGMGVEEVKSLILAAKDEPVIAKRNGLCDAPSTVLRAYGSEDLGTDGVLLLFSTGGCGNDQLKRKGPATKKLESILNLHCPYTMAATTIEEM